MRPSLSAIAAVASFHVDAGDFSGAEVASQKDGNGAGSATDIKDMLAFKIDALDNT